MPRMTPQQAATELTRAYATVERATGRRYVIAKRFRPTGKCMERGTLRRYDLIKLYV